LGIKLTKSEIFEYYKKTVSTDKNYCDDCDDSADCNCDCDECYEICENLFKLNKYVDFEFDYYNENDKDFFFFYPKNKKYSESSNTTTLITADIDNMKLNDSEILLLNNISETLSGNHKKPRVYVLISGW
jgi:hypothetical protein